MAENSNISWTDHTFNPWIGCARVSPACDGCYAAAMMGVGEGRFERAHWGGPGKGEGTRVRTAPSNWAKVRKWNREAAGDPGKTFVFCASLADVFDNAVPTEWRRDLFDLIRETPNLTYLLLTKRPGMIVKLFAQAADVRRGEGPTLGEAWPRNAAIGCSVVNQEEAERDIPKLLMAKRELNPAFAFLSMEPLLGPVNLWEDNGVEGKCYLTGAWYELDDPAQYAGSGRGGGKAEGTGPKLDWIITGGETDQGGHKARPAHPDWYRSLRDQCARHGTPFHFKQWGEWVGFDDLAHSGAPLGPFPHVNDLDVYRVGKDRDPCTLDGVVHGARPLGFERQSEASHA